MVTANQFAGQELGDVYAHLAPFARANKLRPMCTLEEVDWEAEDVQVVFACLPHAVTAQAVKTLPPHLKIVDLSADFRLKDAAVYEEWYDTPHVAPDLLEEAVYGLCELVPEQVAAARLIANPGCYPTSVQLPLIPIIAAGAIETSAEQGGHIVVDSCSGTSGAGRATGKGKEHLLYAEASGSFLAYGVGHHRHMPEIEQGLVEANGGEPVDFSFTPHLLPMTRGILSTMYVKMKPGTSAADLQATLAATYEEAAFVDVLPLGKTPATAHVRGSNRAAIGVVADRTEGRAIVVCAIDNLVKGASGAAVQNMNLQFGWPETTGAKPCSLCTLP